MFRKNLLKLFIITGIFFITGCDIIKEGDRLIPITGGSVREKKVLLVEFTDQNCRNCPNATNEINKLKDRFSDTLIAVSIHANPLPYPLVTKEGNEYEQYFQAEDHPDGIIDGGMRGQYGSHDPQVWGGFILERLKPEPTINIDLSATFNETSKEATISVELKGNKALSNAKLQLWIIESNIKQWQLMPDGTRNDNYIHNHVFRTSVNGTRGESFSIGSGEKKDFNYTCIINAAWKPEDIAIVGFAFNPDNDEVFNVQEISLTNKTE